MSGDSSEYLRKLGKIYDLNAEERGREAGWTDGRACLRGAESLPLEIRWLEESKELL